MGNMMKERGIRLCVGSESGVCVQTPSGAATAGSLPRSLVFLFLYWSLTANIVTL